MDDPHANTLEGRYGLSKIPLDGAIVQHLEAQGIAIELQGELHIADCERDMVDGCNHRGQDLLEAGSSLSQTGA